MRFKLEVNHERKWLTEALGLPRDRANVISKRVAEAWWKYSRVSEMLEEVVEKSEDFKEVVFAVLQLGRLIGSREAVEAILKLMGVNPWE